MSPSTSLSTLARLKDTFPQPGLAPLRAVAFYTAVLLPFVYLPIVAGGITAESLPIVLGLLGANAVALVLGHDYKRE